MDKIKQIRKDFNFYSKELAKLLKRTYANTNDDIDYFLCFSCDYDYLSPNERKDLEDIVLNNQELFKLINKCKINMELIIKNNVTDFFNRRELDMYTEMYDFLRDATFSKQFKIKLMRRTMIVNNKKETKNEPDNNLEI